MDLTTDVPSSPKDKLLGMVSLKRTIDKAKAFNEGKLGEYHFDCPHDKPLFDFLGTNAQEFAQKVKELGSDQKITEWIDKTFLQGKAAQEIEKFNAERMAWHAKPGEPSYDYFSQLRDKLMPGRDNVSWFDLLDSDEKRGAQQAATAQR